MSVQAVEARPEPLPLEQVQGPSAFGGGWRRFGHLTWLIAATDFKLGYFGSVLGYLWSLLRPLLFFGVLYVVFTHVVRFGTGVANYPVLLLMNLVLFSFFQEGTNAAVASVLTRESLVRKMHFPRLVIPLATVLTAAMNLSVNLIAVIVFMLIYGVDPMWTWLLLPVILVPLAMFTAGMSMILSAFYVRYRDVAPIWMVVGQMLFYVTPLFWTIERAPENVREIAACNPIATLLIQARRWFVDPTAPGAATEVGGAVFLVIPLGLIVGTFLLGIWVFNRRAPRIAEDL